MKALDFISGAPKTFIFQQGSNKTNLGGILTVLFIIAIIVIIFAYLYEYIANEKYVVSYYYNEEHYEDEELDNKYDNKKLYPELTLGLGLSGNKSIVDNIIILDRDRKEVQLIEEAESEDGNKLKGSDEIIQRVPELSYYIYHKCLDENHCDLRDDGSGLNLINLLFAYNGFFCDHQNPETPIKQGLRYKYFPFTIEEHIDFYLFDWKIIKYTEDSSFSGMFKTTKETYGGEFTKPDKYSIPSERFPKYQKVNETTGDIDYYQLAAVMGFNGGNTGYYDNYSRERISIFDAIANICALVTTLYGVITFIFCGFYSNSFDNYKIVEKILSRTAYSSTKEIKDINDEIPKEQIELKDQIESDKGETLLEVNEDNKKMVDDNKEKESNLKPVFKIPKFHFYDFLYNNVYCDCCKPSSTQGIISSCNDLISKYYSIDAVIYNQLRLDNLFKDYKWNNPQLNNITNNDLISQIKTLSGNITGS